jgi:hypothetical protein
MAEWLMAKWLNGVLGVFCPKRTAAKPPWPFCFGRFLPKTHGGEAALAILFWAFFVQNARSRVVIVRHVTENIRPVSALEKKHEKIVFY